MSGPPRKRVSSALGAVLACGSVGLAGACAPEPAAFVANRPGPAGELRSYERQARPAWSARPDEPIEVRAEPPHGELRVSGAVGARSAPVDFRIEAFVGADWRALTSRTLSPASGWQDWRVDVSELDTSRFRLAIANAGAPEASVDADWSRPVFSQPRHAISRPNVILISLDTLGADYLGTYRSDPEVAVSPHLDALLASSHAFHRAFAPYGNTLVSHATLFSGLQPNRHRIYPDHWSTGFPSLVTQLADHGYHTAGFTEGAYVSSGFGFAQGFDAYDEGAPLGDADAIGALETFSKAATWLESLPRAARFFLFVHTYEVHSPYEPRDPAARAIARALTPGVPRLIPAEVQLRRIVRHNAGGKRFDAKELGHLAALHAAEIHYTDRSVRSFLDRVSTLGHASDTLVVVTSDHGDQFGERGKVGHGESLHNRIHRVPLAFYWPGVIAPGATDSPVQLADVFPTLLELANLPVPSDLDGRSLAAAIRGDTLEERPAVSELRSARGECVGRDLAWNCRLGRYAVQSRRFKLETSEIPPYEHLYDLASDPAEERDVSDRHPEELARHRAWLDAYRARATEESGEAEPLDPATQEQLRALGYLDD